MEHFLGGDWEITPAGGITGKAFFARQGGQELFLKRNSSPFLAMLSAEGVVPKLVWTKRLENGDVISAQHWMNGRELTPEEMKFDRVAKLMGKIHSSDPLLSMLKRLGKKPFWPSMMLDEVHATIDVMYTHPEVAAAVRFLETQLPSVPESQLVVCHGDVNHHNWLLSDEDELFLIDWDGAMIADPAIDLGTLLFGYVEREKWTSWLTQYGIRLTPSFFRRMKWYATAQLLLSIEWDGEKGRFHDMNKSIAALHRLMIEEKNLYGNGETRHDAFKK
ncbi:MULTISPECIES: phosphotransferase family protein [Bacillaceae]|uniref:Phosphotransferase n=1 Tax=Domibacillus aminovorans TaxID=29332 RepID=A0A177KTF3_9BACI|nr:MULTISPECIES: phosphotransferase family protein [Bacillaceae]OAH56255.1 phosphotransferase [Domibacillus aminovorans]OAH62598.1 phosphotransferase [Domibacillus aminovorans]